MPRYALKVEYDGAGFAGWQRQVDQPSVQGAVEAALGRLGAAQTIAAAGRTDAGVHARGQVAMCDMAEPWTPFRLSEAVNYHLKPARIAITDCAEVPDDWHARFSALSRRYLYRILPRRAPLTLDEGLVWRVPRPLDVDAMQAGAAHLLGRHDFTTFRAVQCQAQSPVKTLDRLDVVAWDGPGGQEVHLHVEARSFLHNQVRSLAGTLAHVGAGAWAPRDVRMALDARDRTACGTVAPPHGLALMSVGYPQDPFAPVG